MKHLWLLVAAFLIIGCSNGLNKPITEELSVEEIRYNADRDSSFVEAYKLYRDVSDWLLTDNILNAKYGNITYKQLREYDNFGLSKDEVKAEYDLLYPNAKELRCKADSIIMHYRSIQPDSLLTLSFKSKSIQHSGLFGNYPIFNISVSPLKGKVEQFTFNYYFALKIHGEQEIKDIPSNLVRRGYQETPVSKTVTIGYSGEIFGDVLDNVSTYELIRDYNFIYEITNVRYKNQNWEDLPYMFRYIIEKDVVCSDFDLDTVVKEMIDKDYKPFVSFYSEKIVAEAAKKYPKIYALYNDFYAANPDYFIDKVQERN